MKNLEKKETCFKDCYDYIEFQCHNINKYNKTSAFPILKQYFTRFSFIFIIKSNEKSLSVLSRSFEKMYNTRVHPTVSPRLGQRWAGGWVQ